MQQNTKSNKDLTKLVICAVLIALAIITNQLKIHMPQGGSITLFSMLFVSLCGYFTGPKYGFISGIAFGFLNCVIGGFSGLHWLSFFLDYLFAYGIFGLSGFFRNSKAGLYIGYVVSVIGRFFFSWLSGLILFGSYAPEGQAPWLYSLIYQTTYIVPELVLTIIVLAIPPVHNILYRLKDQYSK